MNLRSLIIALLLLCCIDTSAADVPALPALYVTTTDLNFRSGPGKSYTKMLTLPKGDTVKVVSLTYNNWARVEYNTNEWLYCSFNYLQYCCPVPQPAPEKPAKVKTSGLIPTIISWIWSIALWVIIVIVVRKLLLWGAALISMGVYKVYWIVSLPFYFLNWFQRYASKPWRLFYKFNSGNDARNSQLREIFEWVKIPFYLILMPLRFVNAVYYNMVVHCSFEAMNYLLEVLYPAHSREGADSWWEWALWLPWRVIKYPLWHGTLTYIESAIWTIADTVMPALTLYHGTDPDASESITQSRGRVGNNSWCTEVWNVGGGNFAGNGIYFAPDRSTALHYSSGSLIVCRVSLGRVIDLGLAPYRIFRECGHADALGATRWGLNNGYTTGEWWRADCHWWEYCMYDWKNRYNHSWRIRPLFVLSTEDKILQRIPGGMHHWLFRKMVINDIIDSFKTLLDK
ncbi:MAG: SH3 domain-containing protein [Muribaculaceae bacterium]